MKPVFITERIAPGHQAPNNQIAPQAVIAAHTPWCVLKYLKPTPPGFAQVLAWVLASPEGCHISREQPGTVGLGVLQRVAGSHHVAPHAQTKIFSEL